MATNFTASLGLSIVADYRKGASFVDVVQKLNKTYESKYTDGENGDQSEVCFAISTTSDGTQASYQFRPMTDVYGVSNTWKKIRDVILVNWDVATSNNRYLLLGGTFIRMMIAGILTGTPVLRVLPAASSKSPGIEWKHMPGYNAQFSLSGGSTITVEGFGGSVGSPLAYDLIVLGTK